jgi:hypothetical protein
MNEERIRVRESGKRVDSTENGSKMDLNRKLDGNHKNKRDIARIVLQIEFHKYLLESRVSIMFEFENQNNVIGVFSIE